MKENLKENRGAVLLVAVLAMLMFTLFAMGFAVEIGTDIDTARALTDKVKTFYIAQAGMNRARTAISVQEAAWTLNENAAGTIGPTTESINGGRFSVSGSSESIDGNNNRTRGRVSIASTGSIGTGANQRTERIVEEDLVWRDMEGYASSLYAGGARPPYRAFDYSVTNGNNNGSNYGLGIPWMASDSEGNGAYLYIDFGRPVSFDYMFFVNGAVEPVEGRTFQQYTIWTWDDVSNNWVQETYLPSSAMEQVQSPRVTGADPEPQPYLGNFQYWVAVNFLKEAPSGYAHTPDCDNNAATADTADRCIGVMPSRVGVKTTRRVKILFNMVSNSVRFPAIDWVQFLLNGVQNYDSANTRWFFTGNEVRRIRILRPPKDLVER